jgi:type IV secretory pathway VirB10-like protein
MPTVIPARSAIALTAGHLKKRRYQIFPHGTYGEISAFVCITGDTVMASNAGIFLAGVGTTFIILGAGFGGGLMMATSALKEPTEYQNRASAEPPSPARVILPSTAEAAQPPQPSQQIATAPEPPLPPPLQPMKGAQAAVERQVENADTRKAEAEQRERRKRYAERKTKRQAERAKRQQQIAQGEHQEAPIMAFGGDEPRRSAGFGFFGN